MRDVILSKHFHGSYSNVMKSHGTDDSDIYWGFTDKFSVLITDVCYCSVVVRSVDQATRQHIHVLPSFIPRVAHPS